MKSVAVKDSFLHHRVALPNGSEISAALAAPSAREVRIPGREGSLLAFVMDFYGPRWANGGTGPTADAIG